MVIDFQTPNFKADSKLLDFISEKFDKLEKFHNHITNATVYLKVANVSDNQNKLIEVKLNLPDTQLFMAMQGQSFEAATDKVVDSLKEQIKRYKKRPEKVGLGFK